MKSVRSEGRGQKSEVGGQRTGDRRFWVLNFEFRNSHFEILTLCSMPYALAAIIGVDLDVIETEIAGIDGFLSFSLPKVNGNRK